jgi:putative (di)nucleoside polyphosphate hydrolase
VLAGGRPRALRQYRDDLARHGEAHAGRASGALIERAEVVASSLASGDGPLRVSRCEPHPGYRPCVGLVLVNAERLLFIGERRGPLSNAWQMPQGGIDPGEDPGAAARRELIEEVGTDRAELLAESRYWYAYDLPPELVPARWGGRYSGQTQKWFCFRFTGTDGDIDIAAHEPEFVRWRWASSDEVVRLAVDFKRSIYQAVLEEFSDLIAG